MSIGERLQLMERLWDSIVAEAPEIELTEPERLNLDRRLAAADASPETGSSWEEVKAWLLSRAAS